VIAVNVGTPLTPRDRLIDVLAVTEQMVNILTEQNVERSLADLREEDILITPDLAKFTSSDFNRGEAIRKAGEEAARAVVERLRSLSVSDEQFAAYERSRSNPVREDRALAISGVHIDGLRTVDIEAVRAELDLPPGKPLRALEIDRAIQRVFGRGDFEAVSYSLIDDPLGRRLVVTPFEKSWGYNSIRLGGNVVTGIGPSDSFNFLAAHAWSWVNSAGGEWRNELQIGDQRRVLTEFSSHFGRAAAGSCCRVCGRSTRSRRSSSTARRCLRWNRAPRRRNCRSARASWVSVPPGSRRAICVRTTGCESGCLSRDRMWKPASSAASSASTPWIRLRFRVTAFFSWGNTSTTTRNSAPPSTRTHARSTPCCHFPSSVIRSS